MYVSRSGLYCISDSTCRDELVPTVVKGLAKMEMCGRPCKKMYAENCVVKLRLAMAQLTRRLRKLVRY